MSDLHHDPNLQRGVQEMSESDRRFQWAAVGVLLLLCGGIFLAAMYSNGSDSQTAMNVPSAQTTGQGPGPAPSPTPRH